MNGWQTMAWLKNTLKILPLLLMTSLSSAQDYPSRTVRLVVPYAAGGAPDVLARLLAQRLMENLNQSFVVENKPGAGGIGASELVAKAPNDGYTLLIPDVPQLALNPFLFSKLPYDPVKDFAPVSIVAMTPMFIAVHPASNLNSLQALLNLARSKPGQLSYGSAGIGSLHHIAMESLKAVAGVDITHVPYKGTGQSVPAFIAGDVQIVVSTLAAIEPFIRSGKARLLAGTPSNRTPRTPDIPAIAETYPGFHFAGEIGVVAPAGTPPAIISRLSQEIQKATRHPDMLKRLSELGAIAVGSTPEAYVDNIKRSLDIYARAVKASGIKAE